MLKGKKLKEFKDAFAHLIYADVEDYSQKVMYVPLSKQDTDKQKLNRLNVVSSPENSNYLRLNIILNFIRYLPLRIKLLHFFKDLSIFNRSYMS